MQQQVDQNQNQNRNENQNQNQSADGIQSISYGQNENNNINNNDGNQMGQFVVGDLASGTRLPTKKMLPKRLARREMTRRFLIRMFGEEYQDGPPPTSFGKARRTRAQNLSIMKHQKIVCTMIKGCKGVVELDLVLKANEVFQGQLHFACALTRLVQMQASNEDKQKVTDYVLQRSEPYVQLYKDASLAQIVWALGKMKCIPNQTYTAKLYYALDKRAKDFLPRGYAMVFHGLANLGLMNIKALDSLSSAMIGSLHYFSTQNLANTAWACATLRYRNRPLLDSLALVSFKRIAEFEQQHLSQLAWAFGKLNYYDPKLFEVIADRVRLRQHFLSPQAIANVAWAFATVGHVEQYLFHKLAQQAFEKISEFTGQGIANLIWSYGKTKNYSQRLFDRVGAMIISRPAIFSPTDLATCAWAFAVVRHYRAAVFDVIAKRALEQHRELRLFDIVNLSSSFAFFNHKHEELYKKILESTLHARHGTFRPFMVTSLMWSMGVMEVNEKQWWQNMVEHLSGLTLEDVGESSLLQLYRLHLLCQAQKRSCFRINRLPKELQEGATHTWLNQPPRPTQFQIDTYDLLKEMNLHPQRHVASEDGQLTVDLMIDLDGQYMAIQAEDESYYTVSEPKEAVFKQTFYKQLLENRGWTVVNLPYFEWELQTTLQSKESYLARKIEKARDSAQLLTLGGQ